MNFVFWLLAIAGLCALWFVISGAFRPFGRFLYKAAQNLKDDLKDDEGEM